MMISAGRVWGPVVEGWNEKTGSPVAWLHVDRTSVDSVWTLVDKVSLSGI